MSLMPVADALARILSGLRPLPPENILLKNAYGRILARPVKATRDNPPFHSSAMDGYAVRAVDVNSLPAKLPLQGVAAAGHAFNGKLKAGAAIRILTGAPVPAGADTVVIQENTTRDGDLLTVVEPTSLRKNIRPRGLDFRKGDELIPARVKLNARDIGLAAAGNAHKVSVHRVPHIVLFTTGDELVLPGQRPRTDQIVSSNSFALDAMLTAWGAKVTNLGIVPDSMRATEAAIRKGLKADIMITTGGASVGDHDYVQQALKNCGIRIGFWKIALRPGKPLMFGTKGKTRVIGLPGNPVSALVCSRIFIRPLINVLQGSSEETATPTATLASPLPINDNRQDYIRATLTIAADGTRRATPYQTQDSSMQRTLRDSQCLIIREPHAEAAKIGDTVSILLLDF